MSLIFFRNLKTGLDLNMIKGFILNIPNPPYSNNKSHQWIFGLVSLPFNMIVSRRHWIAIIRSPADQLFYNLDSKQETPQLIGTDDQLYEYLDTKNNTSGCEIFVVIPRAEDQSWNGLDQINSTS
jgi:josephin